MKIQILEKTYVSYNDGENQQGVPVDVYYLPNGKGGYLTLEKAVKKIILSIPWK